MSGTTQVIPPPVAPPRLLRRSNDDRIIGGVCGGLARYWNIDPIVLRVAFAVSLLVGAFGLFVYLGLWLLVPDESAPATQRYNPFWFRRLLAVLLFLIAGGILLGVMFGGSSFGVLVAALLAGAGVWIVMTQREQPGLAESADDAPEVGYAYAASEATTQVFAPAQPVEPYRRSYLGLIGLLAAMVASGLAVLIGAGSSAVLSAGLLALGVTMIVGGFFGRTRWLLVFAVPLLMLVAVVSQVERASLSVGENTWRPTAQDTSYALTAGTVTVDFSQWSAAPAPTDRVDLDVEVGTVYVKLPRNWDAELITQVGAGSVTVDGEMVKQSGTTRIQARDENPDAEITIAVDVGAGDVIVATDAPAVGETVAKKPQRAKEKKS